MKRRLFNILGSLLFGVVCVSIVSCKSDTKSNSTSKPIVISFTKEGTLSLIKSSNDSIIKTIDIEIADDEYQTQTGLMYRDQMDEKQGMLFIFPDETFRSFYMKNTRIPLDIIFIDSNNTIVSFQNNAKPFDETSLPSEAPAKYVLEINAGLSEAWGLEKGDRITFEKQ